MSCPILSCRLPPPPLPHNKYMYCSPSHLLRIMLTKQIYIIEEIVFGQENLMRNWRGDAGGCGGCWSLGPARGAIFSSIKEKYTSYVSTQVRCLRGCL